MKDSVLPDKPHLDHEIHNQIQQERKRIKVGELKHRRGHTLWEYNTTQQTIVQATVEYSAILYKTGYKLNGRLISKPDCIYVEALNKANVYKHITRLR